MTSTRNKNTIHDYHLEQKQNNEVNSYQLYENSSYGSSYQTSIPELGYTPSKMSREAFSSNYIDIESELRGIGTSNLVTGYTNVVPNYKSIEFKPYFTTIPMIMPKPLVIEKNQRPFPV